MKTKISKTKAKIQIQKFFSDIKDKTPNEVKKIKKIVMSHNIPLKWLRRTFCKKCLSPYKTPKIRINKGIKSLTCENCRYISRWEIRL